MDLYRSDPFHTQRIFVLGTAISNVRHHQPLHISSVPTQSHFLHDTPTYFTVHTRHASILFSIHTLSYCINASSLDHSPSRFVFHSSLFPVRSVRFALILPFLALGCVSFLPSCFLSTFLICALPFSPSLFLHFLITASRDSHHLEYRQSHYSETGNADLVTCWMGVKNRDART